MSKRPLYEFVKVSFPKKASKKSHVGKISKGPLQFLISAKHKLHKPFTKNTCVTFLTLFLFQLGVCVSTKKYAST